MKSFCLTVGAAGALFAAAVVAQDPPAAPPRPRAAAQPAQIEPAPDRAAVAQPQDEQAGFYRASEIIGMSVRGGGGQELGQIQDLMIDGRTQQIRYFILSTGEKVSADSKLMVMPWAVAEPHFGPARDERFVDIRIEQDRLREAPVFTQQQLHAPRPVWVDEVDRFYGVRQGVARPDLRGDVEVDDGEVEIEGRGPRRDREVEIEREDGGVKIERED